jgi:hypothetical protein
MRGHACHFFSTLFSVPVLDPDSVLVPDPFPLLPFHVHPPVPDTDPINVPVTVLDPEAFLFAVYVPFLVLFLILLVS